MKNEDRNNSTSSQKKEKLISKKSLATGLPQQKHQGRNNEATLSNARSVRVGGTNKRSYSDTASLSSSVSALQNRDKKKKVVLSTKGVIKTVTSSANRAIGSAGDTASSTLGGKQRYNVVAAPSLSLDTSLGSANSFNAKQQRRLTKNNACKIAASKKKVKPSERSITSILLLSQRSGSDTTSTTVVADDEDVGLGYCTCLGCTRPRCGQCTLCEESGFLYNTCLLKTCYTRRDYDTEQTNYNEIHKWLGTDRSDVLDVGTRVYAAWNPNDNRTGGWYWGRIVKKYQMKRNYSHSINDYYTIEFDDGDVKKNVDRDEIWSEYKYKILTEKLRLESLVPPPVPVVGTIVTVSGNEIDVVSSSTNHDRMETEVDKFSSANATKNDSNLDPVLIGSTVTGNTVITASVDGGGQHLIAGLDPSHSNLFLTSIQSILPSSVAKQWWKRGCGRCSNCRREACGKCNLCINNTLTNTDESSAGSCRCYQKMCLKIDDDKKFQIAPYFPSGWKFGFIDVAPLHTQWNGFILVAPSSSSSSSTFSNDTDAVYSTTTKTFRSIGRAIHTIPNLFLRLRDEDEEQANDEYTYDVKKINALANKFYSFVGLDDLPDTLLLEQPAGIIQKRVEEEQPERTEVDQKTTTMTRTTTVATAEGNTISVSINDKEIEDATISKAVIAAPRTAAATTTIPVVNNNNGLAANTITTPIENMTTGESKMNDLVGVDKVRSEVVESGEEMFVVAPDSVDSVPISEETRSSTDNFALTMSEMDSKPLLSASSNEIAGNSSGMVRRSSTSTATTLRKEREESHQKYVLSTKRELWARVLAKFYNNEWYWGMITDTVSEKGGFKYTVRYDDGELVVNLDEYSLLTEQEYNVVTKLPVPVESSLNKNTPYDSCIDFISSDTIERVKFPLSELFQRRCKSCPSCLKKDCERCMACTFNKLSTSPNRQVCYLKMCDRIANWEKMQPVPGLPVGWNFYTSYASVLESRNSRCLHPDLAGLCIIPPDGKIAYRSVEDAVKVCQFSADDSRKIIVTFYETLLGIKTRRERSNHQLVGHGYHREWVDGTGKHREVYGTIITCWEPMFVKDGNQDVHFSIRYDKEARDVINSTSLCQLMVPEVDDNVPDYVAWGGFLSFTKKIGMTAMDQMVVRTAPFHFNWIVPTFRYPQKSNESDLHSVVMFTKGFKLELIAKQSSIPNSGLGLWVSCTPASEIVARNASVFELKPGEAVDLGCYAPSDNIDRRPEHVNLIKAFIHVWECESWCFEMGQHHRGNDIFDITDDLSGDLHDKSRRNIVVYANETDGNEVPTLFAEHDPEGAVHYFMGHREEVQGSFRLPTDGKFIELKVDYGPKYEKVRLRKGYTRLSIEDATALRITLKEDDAEVLQEIQEFSAKDLIDIIAFLENLVDLCHSRGDGSSPRKLPHIKLIRALIVSLSLHQRFVGILDEFASFSNLHEATNVPDHLDFCNNGYTDMKQFNALGRSRQLVTTLIKQFASFEQMREAFCSDIVYQSFLINHIGVSSLDTISAESLHSKLLSFVTCEDEQCSTGADGVLMS